VRRVQSRAEFIREVSLLNEGEWQSLVQLRSRSSYLIERFSIFVLGCRKSLSCRAIAPDAVVDLFFNKEGLPFMVGINYRLR